MIDMTYRSARASRNRPRRRSRWPLIGLLVLLAVAAIAGGVRERLDWYLGEAIAPGVTIDGVDVGGLRRAAAQQRLDARYALHLAAPVIITDGTRRHTPAAADIGLAIDVPGAIERAYVVGRSGGARELAARTVDQVQPVDIALAPTIDRTRLAAYVAGLANEIDAPASDAVVALAGTQVQRTPARDGRAVIRDATADAIADAALAGGQQPIPIVFRLIAPSIDDSSARMVEATVIRWLTAPVTMTVGEQSHTWDRASIAEWITLARDDAGWHATLDDSAVVPTLTALAEATAVPASYPRVRWQAGALTIARPGTPGRRLDVDAARTTVRAAFEGESRTVALALAAVPPIGPADLTGLGIEALVDEGVSDFRGSAAYRITNIVTGMEKFDGLLLAPGEEFSFNTHVGAINAANGFVQGSVILDNRTQREFGGGICQVSTTFFRAAFWGGLPITERTSHSFYINWYDRYGLGPAGDGAGLDAAIFTGGGPDLRFVNDTPSWMLIQTSVDRRRATARVRLYGPKLDRSVEIADYRVYNRVSAPREPVYIADRQQPSGTPRQSDRARGGMTIDLFRIVRKDGVALAPELFRTRFRSWPNIFVVNPADLGPDGKPLPSPTPDPAVDVPTPELALDVPTPVP